MFLEAVKNDCHIYGSCLAAFSHRLYLPLGVAQSSPFFPLIIDSHGPRITVNAARQAKSLLLHHDHLLNFGSWFIAV